MIATKAPLEATLHLFQAPRDGWSSELGCWAGRRHFLSLDLTRMSMVKLAPRCPSPMSWNFGVLAVAHIIHFP
ncbi:hypothetical protein ColTof4_09383 [Colletotrichum tofieldiae]|nr:hypothetical protein ColTof3_12672 [Colletotrichum tofieldiae]GKT76960.1 hypothetical protein ColTof4_09383 [Colletotrichum tofieldiae]GKT92592.1 hypothetical protein Ct61P_10442 [Colletotrichum tofieldiae]